MDTVLYKLASSLIDKTRLAESNSNIIRIIGEALQFEPAVEHALKNALIIEQALILQFLRYGVVRSVIYLGPKLSIF